MVDQITGVGEEADLAGALQCRRDDRQRHDVVLDRELRRPERFGFRHGSARAHKRGRPARIRFGAAGYRQVELECGAAGNADVMADTPFGGRVQFHRSEEHTTELHTMMRTSYALYSY